MFTCFIVTLLIFTISGFLTDIIESFITKQKGNSIKIIISLELITTLIFIFLYMILFCYHVFTLHWISALLDLGKTFVITILTGLHVTLMSLIYSWNRNFLKEDDENEI